VLPPEEDLNQIKPIVRTYLNSTANQIPAQWVLFSPAPAKKATASPGWLGTVGPVGAFRLARLILRLSPDMALGCLLLVTLLAIRTAKSWLRWWGIPLFITGGLTILLSVFSMASFERGWGTLLANRTPPNLAPGVISLGHDLARAILQKSLAGLLLAGLVIGLAGLALWIGSAFIKPEAEPQVPAGNPAEAV
jgi:hypothetical protein